MAVKQCVRTEIVLSLLAVFPIFGLANAQAGGAGGRHLDESSQQEAVVDFSGDWRPEFDRWEGHEALMELQQANWVIRRSVGTVPVIERMTQTEEYLEVELVGPVPRFAMKWFVTKQRMMFDNTPREESSPLGVKSLSRHYWETDTVLIHVHDVKRSDGLEYRAVQRRTLSEDGLEQYLKTSVEISNGEHLRAIQVYTKQDELI